MADDRGPDVGALYARHGDELLVFFVRRTSDTEVALDLWGETFAQAVAGRGRCRGRTEEEAGAWLYGIARRQLARYYRRGSAERRAMTRLGIERPTINRDTEAEIMRRAGLEEVREAISEQAARQRVSRGMRTLTCVLDTQTLTEALQT
jgi:DNA-directed RNA polymerase specialized sigma24 family protein